MGDTFWPLLLLPFVGHYGDGGGPGTRMGFCLAKHRASDELNPPSQQLQPCNWRDFATQVAAGMLRLKPPVKRSTRYRWPIIST